ncbi:MAG: tetratricopeptide repeat protein, partial [Candidatus Promineifilaceae bacterium]
ALALYEESLQVDEQIGDIKGKATSLSVMANLFMGTGEWGKAESLILESLQLSKQLGHLQDVAFNIVKLGQIAENRDNISLAKQRYESGISIFRRLGMRREVAQVERMIASLGGKNRGAEQTQGVNPLQSAVQSARAAAKQGAFTAAVTHQQQAVAHARTRATDRNRDALVTLSVLLYNLAGYHQKLNQHAEAVACLEEVVALDKETGHEDLAADQQALAAAQAQLAASTAETTNAPDEDERAEQAAQARFAAHLASLSEDEQVALLQQVHFEQAEQQLLPQLANVLGGNIPPEQYPNIAASIDPLIAQIAADDALSAARHDLAALLQCATDYLRGQPHNVPARYAEQWAAWGLL